MLANVHLCLNYHAIITSNKQATTNKTKQSEYNCHLFKHHTLADGIEYTEIKNVTVGDDLRTLSLGATGADVIELQSTLLILGYNPEGIDGIFGVKTASAVIQFQKDNGLFPDEVVGPITWGSLQRLIASHQIYIIQPGDTFYKIALAFGLPLSELLAINVGIEPYELRVGQMIQRSRQQTIYGSFSIHCDLNLSSPCRFLSC